MLRIDVTNWNMRHLEYGLVDHGEGENPINPTLFVGAYCSTKEDERWLKEQVDKIVRDSERQEE